MLKKLPIGIQTFSQIQEENYLYIDKTKEAFELIESYKYAFLSRPRRFGKSLFLDTLKNIFEGKKELFEGLYIYDKWDWSKKHPVIKISWDGKLRTLDDLEQKAKETFLQTQFDIDNIDLEVILYQSGYLTIDEMIVEEMGFMIQNRYRLKVPNLEVQTSLSDYIIKHLLKSEEHTEPRLPLYKALKSADMEGIEDAIRAIFAAIPYNNYSNNTLQNYEGFYASVLFVYLQSLGIEIIGEDITKRGRIDLTLKIENLIYIIEFKVDDTADALQQIQEKNYAQKYLSEGKEIVLVGIHFDSQSKNISRFEYKLL